VLGKDVRYKQVIEEELLQQRASRGSAAPGQVNARTGYREVEQLQSGEFKESFFLQHIREVALVGLDQGELVTIPGLHDGDEWTRFEAARRAMLQQFGTSVPAPRYRNQARRSA
jgi:hypothetical protein